MTTSCHEDWPWSLAHDCRGAAEAWGWPGRGRKVLTAGRVPKSVWGWAPTLTVKRPAFTIIAEQGTYFVCLMEDIQKCPLPSS
jgi:hypothetical protein